MAKKNLLQIVQSVMSSMNSDSVNSIADLEESMQIAEKAQEVYEDLMALEDWEHLRTTFQLEAVADSERPNYLKLPQGVATLGEIWYDKRKAVSDAKNYELVEYLDPDSFLRLVLSRKSTESSIKTVNDFGGAELFIKNNLAPTYWTSFDGEYLVFDSWDSGIDSTLQQSKNTARGTKETVFTLSDEFIPDLPSKMFPAYIQEVTRVCSLYFREQPSPNDERRSFRSLANQKNRQRANHKKVRYGRR